MNYTLMHKSVQVVDIMIDEVTGSILEIGEGYNLKHLPVCIAVFKGQPDRENLNKWWISRSIPASRSGIRDALEIMNIAYPRQMITKCLGLSLSDQYWVNSKSTPTEWEKVNFFDNNFFLKFLT